MSPKTPSLRARLSRLLRAVTESPTERGTELTRRLDAMRDAREAFWAASHPAEDWDPAWPELLGDFTTRLEAAAQYVEGRSWMGSGNEDRLLESLGRHAVAVLRHLATMDMEAPDIQRALLTSDAARSCDRLARLGVALVPAMMADPLPRQTRPAQ